MITPDFPIYIVSKGRWESRMTARALEEINIDYRIVIEEQEFSNYASCIHKRHIIVLDKSYQRDYDTLDDLGLSKSVGPGPARNFAWDHAMANGFDWHWVMDDNINGFYRFHKNLKTPCRTYKWFQSMQDFVLRFQNVAMAGPNYFMFVSRKSGTKPPFILNTRIYSCNFIRNDVPFRWRGRYNEDTDLSLRMLKSGWCTIQFNAMLQNKCATQILKGGNTDAFYAKEGTLPKSQMLVATHPDVSRLVYKFHRWHHYVDYSKFKGNKLIYKEGIDIQNEPNNYGMRLVIKERA